MPRIRGGEPWQFFTGPPDTHNPGGELFAKFSSPYESARPLGPPTPAGSSPMARLEAEGVPLEKFLLHPPPMAGDTLLRGGDNAPLQGEGLMADLWGIPPPQWKQPASPTPPQWQQAAPPPPHPLLGERSLTSPSSTYASCVGWQETVTTHPSGKRWQRDEARRRGSPP